MKPSLNLPRLPVALIGFAAVLALLVVGLGAYVRLSDAGLGCPDWPGCYGQVSPNFAADAIAAAQRHLPDGPVSPAKAWKEMIHRYLASTLGLAILALACRAWLRERGVPLLLSQALLGLVVFQGLLGMWTVTFLLRPVVVSAHLLGGMATVALLVWLLARQRPGRPAPPAGRWLAASALLTVALQIGLGGWVSTHYADLACTGFPTCNGSWWPHADWAGAFQSDAPDALVAMHWAHRLGALAVLVAVGALALRLLRQAGGRLWGAGLLILLAVQLLLGVANVVDGLPLAVAVAHTVAAAVLLSSLVWLNVSLAGMANRRLRL